MDLRVSLYDELSDDTAYKYCRIQSCLPPETFDHLVGATYEDIKEMI